MPRRSPNALCFPRVRAWLSEGDLPERMPRFRCPTGTECCCHQTRARGPKSREEGAVTGEQGRRGGTGHAEACDVPPSRLPRWRYTPPGPWSRADIRREGDVTSKSQGSRTNELALTRLFKCCPPRWGHLEKLFRQRHHRSRRHAVLLRNGLQSLPLAQNSIIHPEQAKVLP